MIDAIHPFSESYHTAYSVLDEMDLVWIPVIRTTISMKDTTAPFQGLNKTEITDKYGEEQVHLWRRSYDGAHCLPFLKMIRET